MNKLTKICLFLLALLPLGSAFNLTWKELLRLFLITLGLAYLYFRHLRVPKSQGTGVPSGTGRDLGPVLLSLIYIFILTQFDPATSAINDIIPQPRLNWFFISSSVLVFVAFVAFLLQGPRGDGLKPRTLDKFILLLGSGLFVLSVASKLFLGPRSTVSLLGSL
ncbi:MAG TPA: hypothetical protein EYP61_03460, partial [Candidatus Latescibacteria bacterium]|nr:hypothetical protein [Candidatus Latescibacterota bacterium]